MFAPNRYVLLSESVLRATALEQGRLTDERIWDVRRILRMLWSDE